MIKFNLKSSQEIDFCWVYCLVLRIIHNDFLEHIFYLFINSSFMRDYQACCPPLHIWYNWWSKIDHITDISIRDVLWVKPMTHQCEPTTQQCKPMTQQCGTYDVTMQIFHRNNPHNSQVTTNLAVNWALPLHKSKWRMTCTKVTPGRTLWRGYR